MTQRKTPSPEALANIPAETALNWIAMRPIAPGTIVGKHLAQCSSNGGTVSSALCPRCNRTIAWRYRCALAQLDSRAGGR